MTKNNRDKDVQFIEALAVLLREHDLNEVEVNREFGQDDSLTVRVARGSQVVATAPVNNPVIAAPVQESYNLFLVLFNLLKLTMMILLIIQAQ